MYVMYITFFNIIIWHLNNVKVLQPYHMLPSTIYLHLALHIYHYTTEHLSNYPNLVGFDLSVLFYMLSA